jgi:laccase
MHPVIILEYNEEVEITFQGTDVLNASENHPMHMHGYTFYVVGSGSGNFNNETDPVKINIWNKEYMWKRERAKIY